MSYIIAFATFPGSSYAYPFNCYRTDLNPGDEVIVSVKSGELKPAVISYIKYLNWSCESRIECKTSECCIDNNGHYILPSNIPITHGIATLEDFHKQLILKRWTLLKITNKTYIKNFACTNKSSTAYISTRRNGIDIHILNTLKELNPDCVFDSTFPDRISVRHHLNNTKFNLLEGLLRFADSFQSDEKNLSRYFIQQGNNKKAIPER